MHLISVSFLLYLSRVRKNEGFFFRILIGILSWSFPICQASFVLTANRKNENIPAILNWFIEKGFDFQFLIRISHSMHRNPSALGNRNHRGKKISSREFEEILFSLFVFWKKKSSKKGLILSPTCGPIAPLNLCGLIWRKFIIRITMLVAFNYNMGLPCFNMVIFPSKTTTRHFWLFGMNMLIWLQRMFLLSLSQLFRLFTRLPDVISFLWNYVRNMNLFAPLYWTDLLFPLLIFVLVSYFTKSNALVLKLFWSNLMAVPGRQL